MRESTCQTKASDSTLSGVGPDAYHYELPTELIAQVPAPRRGDARLLVVPSRGLVSHASARVVARHLPVDALVVVNTSKVVPARLFLQRDDGRSFELLLCSPAARQGPGTRISAWVRHAKRLREGDRIAASGLALRDCGIDPIDPRAHVFEVLTGDVLVACEAFGQVPLPPYIRREAGPDGVDRERYQTVFADAPGSIAAPTAGLHWEPEVLASLDVARITLHVGPGTFLPLQAADVRDHRVGSERLILAEDDAERIEAARRGGRPIVAIGTTVARALESLALGGRPIAAAQTATDLVILPGFPFQVVTHLLTNFHLPCSSLLMLVCSFAGRDRVLEAYATAVEHRYRFYSYGDCMLCERVPASP